MELHTGDSSIIMYNVRESKKRGCSFGTTSFLYYYTIKFLKVNSFLENKFLNWKGGFGIGEVRIYDGGRCENVTVGKQREQERGMAVVAEKVTAGGMAAVTV